MNLRWVTELSRRVTPPGLTLAAAGVAAAILSVEALSSLAREAGFAHWSAWLLPVAVDALAVAAWWFHRQRDRIAGWVALMVTVISMAGNAASHLIAEGIWQINAWIIAACAITPPASVAACVWLQRQRGRHVSVPEEYRPEPVAPESASVSEVIHEDEPDATPVDAPVAAEPVTVAESVAPEPEPAGRDFPDELEREPAAVELPCLALVAALPVPSPVAPVAETVTIDRETRLARVREMAEEKGVTSIRAIRTATDCSWDDAKAVAKMLAERVPAGVSS
jgi:hypothetical protein